MEQVSALPVASSREHSVRVLRRGLVGALVAGLVVVQIRWPDGNLGEAVYLAVLLGAGIVALWGAFRRPRATRTPWVWIAAGVCSSGLGDLSNSVYLHLKGFEPDVSVADVFWLASYLAIATGLLMLVRRYRRGDGSDVDGMIDMIVVAVVALLVIWQVSIQATISDTSVEPGVRAVWASYPILDAALLALVVRTALSRIPGSIPLAGGVLCWLFADLFYLLFPNSTAWAAWLAAGWMIGATLVAVAVWAPDRPRPPVTKPDNIGAGRVALAIAPLLVPPLIELVTYQRGVDPDPVPLMIASCVLAALAFVRSLRLVRASADAHAELEDASRHFEAIVQRSSDAAFVIDPEGLISYVSPAVRDQFGYAPEELVGTIGRDLMHPDDVQPAIDALSSLTGNPGAHASVEVRIRDASGRYRWIEQVVTNMFEEPAVQGLVANIRDISNRKAAEQQLSRLAHYDDLTGLPNRRQLAQQLGEEMEQSDASVALLVVDLDHFKVVNDSRSHAVGDLLIGAVARRLRKALPEADVLGRTGGDEFGVVCRDVTGDEEARARANLIEEALREPLDLHASGTFAVSVSIGIALTDGHATAHQLLQQADTAMYAAKARGRAQTVVFDRALRRHAEEQVTVQSELRAALTNGELVVHYQPVIDLETGGMDGVEALVRWQHPTRGLLLPIDFIPIAEQSELISAIGAFVLSQACTDASWWARAGHQMTVAVNVSGAQLRGDTFGRLVSTVLYDSGLDPALLVIEITETAMIDGSERALETIAAIRALGVQVALDDFGTGYSSLSFLKSIPADIVKIDRSFVTGIVDVPMDRDITRAVIELATALGRSVVAEGIESEDQRAVILQLGCRLGQGFLWSPAVPSEQVLARCDRPRTAAPARRAVRAEA